MVKFGFRNKNFYPTMFLIFIILRLCIEKLMKAHKYKDNIGFLFPFLIFISQSLICFFIHLYYYKKKKSKERKSVEKQIVKLSTIQLMTNTLIPSNDSIYKIRVLIIFASFFNFLGCAIRSDDIVDFGDKEENNSFLEVRIRSIQILISSLLCHFTMRLTIYKHHKLSLIIITIFSVIIIILEFYFSESLYNIFIAILICTVSCLFRSFLDASEKYLFDFNYIEILKIVIYEGSISLFLCIIYFLTNTRYKKQAKNLLNDISEFDWSFVYFIFLILIYLIVSGLRNSYRVATNKFYSPMLRALIESSIDPFLFIYNFFVYEKKEETEENWIYFGFILFCLTVISISTFIYNELIVLYCCGLEYNTYYEINKRLYFRKQSSSINDNIDNIFYEEENNEDNESDKDDYGKDNKTELKSTLEKEQSLIFESF